MPERRPDPELCQILGALILGADHAVTPREIRRIVEAVAHERQAEFGEGPAVSDDELLAAEQSAARPPEPDSAPEDDSVASSTGIDDRAVKDAFAALQARLREVGVGMQVVEVSGGYRLQTAPECGPWVRRMLNRGKPHRISRPMIETLAIVAYRQPIARSEIESIRGVGVGHVIKALMELRLVRIVGRSDLPGRPFLFGTTATFLEHFGLKSLDDLNVMQPGVARTPPAEQRAKHSKPRPRPAPAPTDATPTVSATDAARTTITVEVPPESDPPPAAR